VRFAKYHALGNDYLVVEAAGWQGALDPPTVRRVCDRHFGLGSDGILVHGVRPGGGFALRILNPDGSEAEKSGNGLRIFARYLWDAGLVGAAPFDVTTPGGTVRCEVRDRGRSVVVDMGRVSFASPDVPVAGPDREVVRESLEVRGRAYEFTAATVGNPHCVLVRPMASADEARTLGPLVETDPRFPRRTNVQFMQVLDRHTVRIEIWERGAGYTLASGSSSCAAAAAACRLGLCDSPVAVRMPGGPLLIEVGDDYAVRMTGPVTRVADGNLHPECLADDRPPDDAPGGL
jgi:diaminopimelate epimerase